MHKKTLKLITFVFIAFFICSCNNKTVYSHFETLPLKGWNADSLVHFTFNITDTTIHYNVLVCVRNKKNYPYQNLWFFIAKQLPNQTLMKDTIECYLADQRGRWLGSGIGAYLEMPVLYEQNIQFSDTGKYIYSLQHGMREDMLTGLQNVGIVVEKAN